MSATLHSGPLESFEGDIPSRPGNELGIDMCPSDHALETFHEIFIFEAGEMDEVQLPNCRLTLQMIHIV